MFGKLVRYSTLKPGDYFTFESDIVSNPLHLCERTENEFLYFDGECLKEKAYPFGDPVVLQYCITNAV